MLTKTFPAEEKYKLISQINRAVVFIPLNIAEGAGRNTKGEFKNFLGNANGSLFELETQLILSKDLYYIDENNSSSILTGIQMLQKMIYNLIKSLK